MTKIKRGERMKKNILNYKKALIILLIISLCLIGGYLFIFGNETEPEKVMLNASRTYRYSDIEELTMNSDFIGIIEVTDDGTTQNANIIPHTIFSAKVIKPVYNCEENEEIKIFMTGGIKDNCLFEISDDPLMKKGDKYLIFARKNDDGTLTALGGSQGRMFYQDGHISSLNTIDSQVKENSSSPIDCINTTDEEIINEINKAIYKK